jgi:hypothetical protein
MSTHIMLEQASIVIEDLGIEEPVYIAEAPLHAWREAFSDSYWPDDVLGAWDFEAWQETGEHLIWVREGLPENVAAKVITHELKHAQQGERMRAGEPIPAPTEFENLLGIRGMAETDAWQTELHYFGEAVTDEEFDAGARLP